VWNYIFLITILKYIKLPAYDHSELASLYTVPLSTVNGLSRLTKLTTSKGAGTADSIRKFSNRPIPFESNQPIRIRIYKLCRSLLEVDRRNTHRRTQGNHRLDIVLTLHNTEEGAVCNAWFLICVFVFIYCTLCR